MKKIIALCTVAVLGMTLFTGCGKGTKKTFERYAECIDTINYNGIEYVPADRIVTQEEIDAEIDSFCRDNSVTENDYTSPVKDGDMVNIDYMEKLNGSDYSSQSDYNITIGYDTLGTGFDAQLIGAKPGDVREVFVTYPEDYSDVTLAGLTVSFDVTINYISVTTIPEYTNDLVGTATEGEYTTTDDYTAYLTEKLQDSKNDSADNSDRTNILQRVIDNTTFIKYPEQEMETYIIGLVENLRSSAENYGINFETFLLYFYGYDSEQAFLSFLSETVVSVMQEKIVVSSIALQENLIASDADIEAYKTKLITKNGLTEEDIADFYTDDDLVFYATEEKVLDYLVEHAVAVDEIEEDTVSDGDTEVAE